VNSLEQLHKQILSCRRCPRLVDFREKIAREKRKQFIEWTYWGKPVPGYGHPDATLLIVGLAPAAHGGNRTGRVFTGDKSAEFLLHCLHASGLANQPHSIHRDDGLDIYGGYMTAALKCVPPGDKPTAGELKECRPYFQEELHLLKKVRIILTLGKIAHDAVLAYYLDRYKIIKKEYSFGHFSEYVLPDKKHLIHPIIPVQEM